MAQDLQNRKTKHKNNSKGTLNNLQNHKEMEIGTWLKNRGFTTSPRAQVSMVTKTSNTTIEFCWITLPPNIVDSLIFLIY